MSFHFSSEKKNKNHLAKLLNGAHLESKSAVKFMKLLQLCSDKSIKIKNRCAKMLETYASMSF